MTKHVLLNNIQHQTIRVISQYAEDYGDNMASVMVYPTEFGELQKEYPILLRQNPDTGLFFATALLGLQQQENLFLDRSFDSGWAAHYIPVNIAKGPFVIGFQRQPDNPQQTQSVIHIDLAHPKVNEQQGQPLFLEHGGNSPYLDYIAKVLKIAQQGLALNNTVFNTFTQMELIEPLSIDIELLGNDKHRLSGYFTISESKLQSLSAAQLAQINGNGMLSLAYAIIFSLTNIRKLIDIKNRRNKID